MERDFGSRRQEVAEIGVARLDLTKRFLSVCVLIFCWTFGDTLGIINRLTICLNAGTESDIGGY